ncbi:hypothetical protein CEXT_36661 [Caerostris extrusa]|uniref:Uncharacterized protein n=1 Tax=Caerostris extrusa TaxID=172846 RepID=A0AAV4P7R4_CAEEX|nr:hypothetical protein CEXT_36661 [Caerostris extrusa]
MLVALEIRSVDQVYDIILDGEKVHLLWSKRQTATSWVALPEEETPNVIRPLPPESPPRRDDEAACQHFEGIEVHQTAVEVTRAPAYEKRWPPSPQRRRSSSRTECPSYRLRKNGLRSSHQLSKGVSWLGLLFDFRRSQGRRWLTICSADRSLRLPSPRIESGSRPIEAWNDVSDDVVRARVYKRWLMVLFD